MTPVLVVGVGMFLYLCITRITTLEIPVVLAPYLMYIVIVCLTMSFFLPEVVSRFPPLRGEYRWISQIVMFSLLFVPVVFFYNIKPEVHELIQLINVFIGTTAFICFTGILQLYVYKLTGKDLFPINMFAPGEQNDLLRSALSRLSEKIKVLRMSGLGGGEPKHFGYTCVMAFNLLFLRWVFFGRSGFISSLINLALASLFIGCIFLSLSTQSYLLLAMDILLLFFLMLVKFGLKKKRVLILFFMMTAGSAFVLQNQYTRTLIEARIYNRLEETGAIEDFNLTVLDFLIHHPKYLPFGTGIGNVHFFAFPYIPNEFKFYMRDSVFVAKAGLLRVISEQGIVGLLLFIAIILFLLIRLVTKKSLDHNGIKYLVLCFLVVTMANFFISSDSAPFFILAFAMGFSIHSILQRNPV